MNQIETKMIETPDGNHAVCLDQDSKFICWVMWKHPDGQWVSIRRATQFEIMCAQAKLQGLKEAAHTPQQG